MSTPFLVFTFLMIVLAPCLLAYVAWSVGDSDSSDERYSDSGSVLARMGRMPAPLQAALPELPIGGDFEIRSFPKGLSQRRLVVRDAEDGPRLTITQVRQAAAELAKIAGLLVAHELALVTAAMVAAGRSLAAAAREAVEAEHHLFAWQAWAGSGPQQFAENRDVGPPRFGPAHSFAVWREESEAA